jgi:hypothetical protein
VEGGIFHRLPLVGPIAKRVGTVGVLGLGLLVAGILGWFLVSNYDTLFAGQDTNTIGPNQANFVLMMAFVAAAGGGVTILGLFMTRGVLGGAAPMAYDAMEGTQASAEVEAGAEAAPIVAQVPAPTRAAPPPAAPSRPAPPPAAAVAEADDIPDEEEEEVGALELPTAPPAPSRPPAAPAASEEISSTDELEDLFGELESEVQAAAEEEEVFYECPNCHGVVKEEDASCPHCQVVFEA